jgi:hypothetical protein
VLNAPTRNLQNIKDKRADQSTKTREKPYRLQVLPRLSHRGWKELIFNKTANVTFRRVHSTTVVNDKQELLHILSVYL